MTQGYSRLIHGKSAYEEYFVINWCFFNICNFSCSYCPTDLHNGKNRGLPLETVKNFCQQVFQNKKDKKVFFEFTGGEITYYKDFANLFKYLKENGAETGLISNGSRDLNFWREHRDLIDHICLSFHPEQGKMDHFYEVVKLLNEVTTVHVNIMMLPEKFEELHGLANRISSEIEGPSVAMQALFQEMSGTMFDYTPEQKAVLDNPDLPWGQNLKHRRPTNLKRNVYRGEMLKIMADGSQEMANPPELIAREENNWLGWKCYIGIENLVIDYNGQIRRGWCNVGGVIGNVQDEVFNFPEKPIVCAVKKCYCGLDIMSTKEKV